MRAVAYIRVSDVSQIEVHSLDAQDRLFKELCKSRGWEPVKVYREEGRSAHVDSVQRRPVFRQLLQDATAGHFDVVVVHTLDRWSRNLKVTLETVSQLSRNNVGLVSITENIDWSNPQGRLFTQMLGAFAEYYSGALSTHVKKGIGERARQGLHLGAIPFGYGSCWKTVKGEKQLSCKVEHSGGVHIHPKEGPAVKDLFQRYAAGTVTLSQLAFRLNRQGYRTRNTHKSLSSSGNQIAEPRLFTTASIRGILHNPFYMGKVRHRSELLPRAHEDIVTEEAFNLVQTTLKTNSGRSMTLKPSSCQRIPVERVDQVCLLRDAHVGPDLRKWSAVV